MSQQEYNDADVLRTMEEWLQFLDEKEREYQEQLARIKAKNSSRRGPFSWLHRDDGRDDGEAFKELTRKSQEQTKEEGKANDEAEEQGTLPDWLA